MKYIFSLILIIFFAGLIFLSDCKPENAYSKVSFNLSLDTLFPGQVPGVFKHPLGPERCVFKWGNDSIITTYRDLKNLSVKLPQGFYQFEIYPLDTPVYSKNLIFYWAYKDSVKEGNFIKMIYPKTDYYLVLLDTVNTWGFLSFEGNSQGYYYTYANSIKHPDFWADYYCGTHKNDSTLYEYRVDSAKAETIYLVKCLLSYNVSLSINTSFVFKDIESTLITK